MIYIKTWISFILFSIGYISYGQVLSDFTFDIKTKYGTNVEISIAVRHGGDKSFNQADPIIEEIHSMIIDSLDCYDAIEMYTTARFDMNLIIEDIYKKCFIKNNIKFDRLILLQVKIPHELNVIFDRQSEITQKYLDVMLIVKNKTDSLSNYLKQNEDLSEKKYEQIKQEIELIKKFDYFNKIYNDNLFDLIMKSGIN